MTSVLETGRIMDRPNTRSATGHDSHPPPAYSSTSLLHSDKRFNAPSDHSVARSSSQTRRASPNDSSHPSDPSCPLVVDSALVRETFQTISRPSGLHLPSVIQAARLLGSQSASHPDSSIHIPSALGIHHRGESSSPSPPLPLLLRCVLCNQSSTWFSLHRPWSPTGGCPMDHTPSNRSASTDPSVPSTSCSCLLPGRSDTQSSHPSSPSRSSHLSASFIDDSDKTTPVVTRFQSEQLEHRSSSARLASNQAALADPSTNWITGELHGICASCHRLPPRTVQLGMINDGFERLDSDASDTGVHGPSSFFPECTLSTSIGSGSEISLIEPPQSSAQTFDHSDSSSFSSIECHSSDGQASLKGLHHNRQEVEKVYIQLGGSPLLSPHTRSPLSPSPFELTVGHQKKEHQPLKMAAVQSFTISRNRGRKVAIPVVTTLPSVSSPPPPRHPLLSRSKDHLDTTLVEISESDESAVDVGASNVTSAQNPLRPSSALTSPPMQHGKVHSPLSPSRSSTTVHRGASLRMMLRQAKIPPATAHDAFRRQILRPKEVWEAAMMATPSDQLRHAGLSSWQTYSATVEDLSPTHRRVPSNMSSSSSLADSRSASLSRPNAATSNVSIGSSLGHSTNSRATRSPTCDSMSQAEPNGRGFLSRKTSLAGLSTTALNTPPITMESSLDLSYKDASHQEVLSISPSLPASSTHPRSNSAQRKPSALSGNLLARFAHHYQTGTNVAESASKNSKRRPSTATGTSSTKFSIKSSPKPGSTHVSADSAIAAKNSKASPPLPPLPSPSSLSKMSTNSCDKLNGGQASVFRRPATACGSAIVPSATVSRKGPFGGRPSTATTRPDASSSGPKARESYLEIKARGLLPSSGVQPISIRPRNNSTTDLTRKSNVSPASQYCRPVESTASEDCAQYASYPDTSSRSLPNTPMDQRFLYPVHSFKGKVSESVGTQPDRTLVANHNMPETSCLRGQIPEEFFSKSRNLCLSVSPRPSVDTLKPGNILTAWIKLGPKAKSRKFNAINVLLQGVINESHCVSQEGAGHSHASQHEFLKVNYNIYPNASEGVRVINNDIGDQQEWIIEFTIPLFANCTCQPGPLPLPASGGQNTGHVSYSIQVLADKRQILNSQESVYAKLQVATNNEARYQVTTRPLLKKSSRGKIGFSGGFLGSIDETTLCHQVYYQSADRLRIGYQIEVALTEHSFLPKPMAEQVCQSMKVEIKNLMMGSGGIIGHESGLLTFVDHRSSTVINTEAPAGSADKRCKWTIKGYLEFKNVNKQMQNLKAIIQQGSRATPGSLGVAGAFGKLSRGRTATGGGQHSLSGSISSSQGNTPTPTATSSGHVFPSTTSGGLQLETERQMRLNNSQLFIIVRADAVQGILSQPIEISNLIGSELVSRCSLRKIGEENMKRVVMEEKMKKVQEVNDKNR